MHKINYEEFFRHHDKTDFENDYLIALGWKKYDKDVLKPTEKYKKLNEKYLILKDSFSSYSWLQKLFLPSELDKLVIYDSEKLVLLFISVYLEKYSIPDTFKNNFKEIVNYDDFSASIRKFFSEYADELSIHSCTYCEAAYTGSYEVSNSEGKKEDKGFFDLDHFFPKGEYPLFALCLYNFVPCCQICNSKRIKGDIPILKFYNINTNNLKLAKEQFLQVFPISNKYSFDTESFIRYIPKLEKIPEEKTRGKTTKKQNSEEKPKYKEWHYSPLSQFSADNYEVYFDTDYSNKDNKNINIIKSMKLNERYNSLAIKAKGLYLIDLKKRYPLSNIKMISDLFAKSKYYISPDEIENAIFHKDEKYILLEKLKKDILE